MLFSKSDRRVCTAAAKRSQGLIERGRDSPKVKVLIHPRHNVQPLLFTGDIEVLRFVVNIVSVEGLFCVEHRITGATLEHILRHGTPVLVRMVVLDMLQEIELKHVLRAAQVAIVYGDYLASLIEPNLLRRIGDKGMSHHSFFQIVGRLNVRIQSGLGNESCSTKAANEIQTGYLKNTNLSLMILYYKLQDES